MSQAGQIVLAEDHPVSRSCVPATLKNCLGTDGQLNPTLGGYGRFLAGGKQSSGEF